MPNVGRIKPGCVNTLQMVADAFGKSKKTIEQWRSMGMPGRAGAWNLDDIAAWKRDNIQSPNGDHSVKPLTAVELNELQQAELDLKKAKAAREQLRLKKEEGDIIERYQLEQFLSEFFTEMRRSLMRIPAEVAVGIPQEFGVESNMRERLTMWLQSMRVYAERMEEVGDE